MPTFIITHNGAALKTTPDLLMWLNGVIDANRYPSKYAAKRHLKQLDNMPEDVKIIELVTVKDDK